MRCTENWRNYGAQRAVISGPRSSCKPGTNGVPQMSVLGPVLFIFINETDTYAECTLRKSTDDTKLGGLADTPDGCTAIQRDLYRLGKWADRHLMELNKGKYKLLPLQRNKLMHQYKFWANGMLRSSERRTLGLWWTASGP